MFYFSGYAYCYRTCFRFLILFFEIIQLIWKENKVINLVAVSIFAIYPGFLQQPIALIYNHHLSVFASLLLSIYLMILNATKEKRSFLLSSISVLLSIGMFSIENFATRLDSKVINKRILENLVKAGALDWTGETRAGMTARLEQVVASASSAQRDKASGQVSMFDAMEFAGSSPAARNDGGVSSVEEWSKDDRLAHEKELLGF